MSFISVHTVHGRRGCNLVPLLLAPQYNSRSVHADILPSAENFEVPISNKEGLIILIFTYLKLRFSYFLFGIQKTPQPQPQVAALGQQFAKPEVSCCCVRTLNTNRPPLSNFGSPVFRRITFSTYESLNNLWRTRLQGSCRGRAGFPTLPPKTTLSITAA